MTREQVSAMYKKTVLKREDYPPQFRCKVNLQDDKVKCYDFEHNPIELDKAQIKGASITPIVHFKSVYFMGANCGLVLDLHSMLVQPKDDKCPFEGLFA